MLFYGMSSESAMQTSRWRRRNIAQQKVKPLSCRCEARLKIPRVIGGLRSACTYVGASRLKELTKRTTFIRVQEQENRIFNNVIFERWCGATRQRYPIPLIASPKWKIGRYIATTSVPDNSPL